MKQTAQQLTGLLDELFEKYENGDILSPDLLIKIQLQNQALKSELEYGVG